MAGLPVAPRRVFGIALDTRAEAGLYTWVCRGTPGADGLRVESVDRLAELPGGCAGRADSYRVLLAKILEAPRSVWGLDFPFGVARAEVGASAPPHEANPWREGWVADLRRTADGKAAAAELAVPRRTERDHGLLARAGESRRIGVTGVLLPLLAHPSVAVLPFDALPYLAPASPPPMAARLPSIFVVEVAPSALLGAVGVAPGDGASVLRALVAAQLVRPLPRALRRRVAQSADGRGLDAVLAAVAAWRASRRDDLSALTRDPYYGREGYVFC